MDSTGSELSVYYDEACLEYTAPPGAFELPAKDHLAIDEPHPERPERLVNIRHIVESVLGERSHWRDIEPAKREQIQLVHPEEYVDDVEAGGESPPMYLTPTTAVVEGTFEAARYAAGAAIQAARRALDTPITEVTYALTRPGGHHAQPAQADGFCFFNNAAIATEHVLQRRDVDKVAIVDWDVHPGNGTTEVFYDREDVLVVSLHNDFGSWGEYHPQTNRLDERGAGAGEGYTVNVPLPPGTGDEGYAYAFDAVVESVVGTFDPDLVVVTAGQDPGVVDPSAPNLVTKAGFETMAGCVRRLAEEHADGSLALLQAGGYQISHLAYATLGVLEGALDCETGVTDPFPLLPELNGLCREWVDDAATAYDDYWPV
jgi:acetoin utilization deacetylase AcuC-like enzyme